MTATTSSPLPIAAIPVERFVERLYAPLAWEATVRLGDPAIASRLVERVLHRAWDERERFATFEALNRHVQDAALSAILAEADRRRDVTRFDDTLADHAVPGSLASMSVEAVRRRIGEGRAPKATPPAVAAVIQATPAPIAVAPIPAAPSPVAPSPVAPSSVSHPSTPRPFHAPRLSMAAARSEAPPPKTDARPGPRASSATPTRKSAAIGLIPGVDGTPSRFTLAQKGIAIGAVVVVALVSVAALKSGGARDPESRALAALADSSGPSHEAARAEVKDVVFPDSSSARLGGEGTISLNADFGDGARALRLAGPVELRLKSDSSAPAAIQVGEHRFVMAGGVIAFTTDAAGLVNVQVDSGDVVLIRDSSRVRLLAGSLVRIGPGTPLTLSREQRDEAFGWRTGRIRLAGASLRTIGTAVRRWYNVEVRFPTERAQADTASLDVPLANRDSLVDGLERGLSARAESDGDRIVLRSAPRSTPDRRGRAASPPTGLRPPPGIVIPQIP